VDARHPGNQLVTPMQRTGEMCASIARQYGEGG